eukprot:6411349-Pyramimonas_sp.AAC.1
MCNPHHSRDRATSSAPWGHGCWPLEIRTRLHCPLLERAAPVTAGPQGRERWRPSRVAVKPHSIQNFRVM